MHRGVAGHVEIVAEKAIGHIAHRQARGIDAIEQHGAVANQRHRRMQFVGAATQRTQLLGRLVAVGRLAEPRRAARQSLVGAEHQLSRALRRHGLRLDARQQPRRGGGIGNTRFGFDRALVDIRGPDFKP